MMNKKASTSMTGLIISLLVVMALFYGGFDYISSNYESANITDQLGYNESYADLQEAQAGLETSVDNIKTAAQGISEADANVVLVAWNGLTGLAYTLRLFIDVIDVGVSVWNAIFPALSFLPNWIKVLMEIAIIITIVLIIVGAFKGENRT